jgi:uncharacterized protein (TIGR00725 family)
MLGQRSHEDRVGSSRRRRIIAVIGSGDATGEALEHAEAVGRALIDSGYRLVTGGLGGVMAAASLGARSSDRWTDGVVLGVLPGLNIKSANPWVDIVIPSGFGRARNVLIVNMAEAVIAIAGGAGTLSEVALAWQNGKLVIAMATGGGWAARLAGRPVDDRRADVVHAASSATEAIEILQELLSSSEGN